MKENEVERSPGPTSSLTPVDCVRQAKKCFQAVQWRDSAHRL